MHNFKKFSVIGFTLVELMVTLSVAGILLAFAVPSYVSLTANNRAATEANKLLAALNLTRSEAVKQGLAISLCARALPRTDPESCAGTTDWASGWLMFTDNSGTKGVLDGSDKLVKVWEGLEGNGSLTGNAGFVQYQSTGVLSGSANFLLSYPNCNGDNNRIITVGLTGRVSVRTSACS